MSGASIQKRAGHWSFSTTQIYIDLAGIEFPDENAKLAEMLWGIWSEIAVRSSGKHDHRRRRGGSDSAQRSGVGVEPTQPGAARPGRF